MESVSDMINRIRNGETVICSKCGKGKYIAPSGYLETSHGYKCDNCGNTIHLTPKDIIVE